MRCQDFNPHIRYIDRVSAPKPYVQPVLAYDFRMFYCLSGSFVIETEGRDFKMLEGDLITIPPATAYRLEYDKNMPEYYILNFDFVSVSDQYTPRPPVPFEKFREDMVFSHEFYGPFGKIFAVNNAYICEKIIEEIYSYDTDYSQNSKNLQSALLKYLLTRIAIQSENNEIHPKNIKLIKRVKEYIDANYNCDISNKIIAEEFGYHPYYLNNIFLKTEKITLHKYIDSVKLENARDLLIHSDISIGEIAQRCGFSDCSYFSKFFFKYMKIKPSQYRDLAR